MIQVDDMVGKLNLSKSNIGMANCSIQIDICQSYINPITYGITNIESYLTKYIENLLENSEYINSITSMDLIQFSISKSKEII